MKEKADVCRGIMEEEKMLHRSQLQLDKVRTSKLGTHGYTSNYAKASIT